MVYTLNKHRGKKLSGRGHSKHKAGSKGGTGYAGHRTHKVTARPKVVHKRAYIKYSRLMKYRSYYEKLGCIVYVGTTPYILSYRLPGKLIQVPADGIKVRGSNVVKYAR